MSFDRLNKWLTLAANLGVVIGLVILILEMRQNAALTRATLEAQKNSFLSQVELNLTSPNNLEAWIKSIRHPEQMTDADIKIIDSVLLSIMLQWDQVFHMLRNGLADRVEAKNHISNSAPYYFGSKFAKAWYKLQAPGWENTLMSEIADPIVLNLDENFLVDYMDSLLLISTDKVAEDNTPR